MEFPHRPTRATSAMGYGPRLQPCVSAGTDCLPCLLANHRCSPPSDRSRIGKYFDGHLASHAALPIIVNSVPCFVQHTEKSAGKVMLVVASRDALIVWTVGAAKRMSRHIQSAALEIEAQLGSYFLGEAFLHINRVAPRQNFDFRLTSTVGDGGHQRHQLLAQRVSTFETCEVSARGS